jgi:hypothetical protein
MYGSEYTADQCSKNVCDSCAETKSVANQVELLLELTQLGFKIAIIACMRLGSRCSNLTMRL